jgi:DNA-binding XRE family transcriptional regulator
MGKRRIWLKNIRERENLSQEKMAEIWGVSRSHIGMIEIGDRDPSVPVAKVGARLFGFDWKLFFD